MAYSVVAILVAALITGSSNVLAGWQKGFLGSLLGTAIVLLLVLIRQQAPVNEAAFRDPLTGLANRRSLDNRFRALKSKFLDHGRPLALISLDLDHFKLVNDCWGHSSGDAVLKMLARCCLSLVRTGDMVARIGGEEFVILLPGVTLDVAAATAERIRAVLESSACAPVSGDAERVAGGAQIRITASFGVAEASRDGAQNLDQLFEAADSRLYRAKEAGRNCIVAQ